MSSNYPAGVTDAHPHFNPAPERATAVECGADSALVIPSFAVKAELYELQQMIISVQLLAPEAQLHKFGLVTKIENMIERINGLEQEREYECGFNDEIDLEESECAQWVCPDCGNDRETDNAPEDRDPDYEYDRRGDDD